jgi:prophage antirepressor-like protein
MDYITFMGHDFTLLTDKDGEPWLIGRELCEFLEIKGHYHALRKLPDDEKQKVVIEAFKTKGRGGDNGNRIIVNEPGWYNLILQSTKPQAQELGHWLRHDVLPSIRRTGSYNHNHKPAIEQTNHIAENFRIPEKLTVKEALLLALDRETAREKACEERDLEVAKNQIAEKTIRQATRKINYLEDSSKQLQRKADSYDQRFNTTGNMTHNGAAKNMGIPPHKFNNDLRIHDIIMKTKKYVMPKQTYVAKGWFVVKERKAPYDETKRFLQSYITPLGMHEIWELIYAPQITTLPTPWRGQKRLFDDEGEGGSE